MQHSSDAADKETVPCKWRGVKFEPAAKIKKFRARIRVIGKPGLKPGHYHLGYYLTAQEAARAADLGFLARDGRNAKTNFPLLEYTDEDIAAAGARLKESKKRVGTSQYRGVENPVPQSWAARFMTQQKLVYLGTFRNEKQAARQYDLAQLYVHGCNVLACKGKLNLAYWPTYSVADLQTLTRDVGERIISSLLRQADPAVVQQEVKLMQPPASAAMQAGAAAPGWHLAAAPCLGLEQAMPAAAMQSPPATASGTSMKPAAAAAAGGLTAVADTDRRAAAAAARGRGGTACLEASVATAALLQKEQQQSHAAAAAAAARVHPATGAAAAVGDDMGLEPDLCGNRKQDVGGKRWLGKAAGKITQHSCHGSPAAVAADPAAVVADPAAVAADPAAVAADPAAAEQVQDRDAFASAAVAAAKERLRHVREEREAARHLSVQQLKAAKKAVKAAKAELKEAKAAAAAAMTVAADYEQPAESAAARREVAALAEGGNKQCLKPQQQQQQQQPYSSSKPSQGEVPLQQGAELARRAGSMQTLPPSSSGSSKRKQQDVDEDLTKPPPSKKQKLHTKPRSIPFQAAPFPSTQCEELASAAAAPAGVPALSRAPARECKQPVGLLQPAPAAAVKKGAAQSYKQREGAATAAAAAARGLGRAAGVGQLSQPTKKQQHHQQQLALLQRVARLQGLLWGAQVQQYSAAKPPAAKPPEGTGHNATKRRRKDSSKAGGFQGGR